MASHKHAEKCIRKTVRQTLVNKKRMSRVRTTVKKFDVLNIAENKDVAQVAFREVQSELARAVKKGLVHRNTLARKVSRMAKKMKAAAGSQAA